MSEARCRSYLACYDYGQGGVWLILDAPSHAAAQAAFPDLRVFEKRPEWMSEVQEAEYRARCERAGFRWNIQAPSGWLQQYKSEFR
jgi:hypothetical protein